MNGHHFRLILTAALSCASLFGAIDGVVVNSTSGKPQAGVSVTLVKPGQGGMKTLGNTTSDASGHFRFEKDQPGGGPQLLQANYGSVNYNKLMTPNIPTSNVELDIYEVTKSPAVANIAQRWLLIEPTLSQIAVDETAIVQNGSKTTFHDEALGSLLFYLPPAANGQVTVNAQGPQGMPLPQAAEKTKVSDVFKVSFPIKPGDTQFDIRYVLPAGSPFNFHGRIVSVAGMPSGPLRLIAPSGVTLAGNDLQNVGTEPKTQATIYTVTAKDLFSFDITGTGSLHDNDAQNVDTSGQPQLTEAVPPIYRHLNWLLGLALGILALGFIVLFRNSPVRSPYGK